MKGKATHRCAFCKRQQYQGIVQGIAAHSVECPQSWLRGNKWTNEDLKAATQYFGPGWPTLQQEPPDLVEVPFTEAVQLLLKHWSPSVQVMLETLKQKYGVVLARSPK